MLKNLKNFIAHFIVQKKYAQKNPPVISFSDFFSKSIYYLVIMPTVQKDFENALNILKFFQNHDKNITIFVSEEDSKSIPLRSKFKFITYNDENATKLNLPVASFIKRLKKRSFDVVIDLNLTDNVFASSIANLVESNFKIGFVKENSDKYYNLQFAIHENNSELSYKNLLNSLGMF